MSAGKKSESPGIDPTPLDDRTDFEECFQIIRHFPTGSSMPVALEAPDSAGGGRYFVKPSNGQPIANLCEWVALGLAAAPGLAIPVPKPQWLRIRECRQAKPVLHLFEVETLETLQRSRGFNLALPYWPEAVQANPQQLRSEHKNEAALDFVYLLDCLLLNVDRSARNPNLLEPGDDGRWFAIDYDSCLYLRRLLTRSGDSTVNTASQDEYTAALSALRDNPAVLSGLYGHPLSRPLTTLNPSRIEAFLQGCERAIQERLPNIVASVPADLAFPSPPIEELKRGLLAACEPRAFTAFLAALDSQKR